MALTWAARANPKARGATVLRFLSVAFAYYIGTYLTSFLTPLAGPLSSLWVPVGIALACLLIFGLRPWAWLGIALGAFAAVLPTVPLPAALVVTFANVTAPVCACLLLRLTGFRNELNRLRDALGLVFLAAFGAMTISATLGATAVTTLTDQTAPGEFLNIWAVWWSSDVLGVLVVTPALLVLRRIRPASLVSWKRWLEMALLLLVTLVVTAAATRIFGFLFLAFPLMIWAAWRFQLPGVTPCAFIVSALAIDAAAHGYGLFAGRPLLANVMVLQAFNGTVVLSGLFLAVLITEWRRSRQAIEHTTVTMAAAVERLQASMLERPGYLSITDLPRQETPTGPDEVRAVRPGAQLKLTSTAE